MKSPSCGRLLAWTVFALTTVATAGGCAVSDSDVHRWETTEAGPEKLYAIVTHDKYSWPLRTEAALSLVRMRSRNGRRIGIEYLVIGYDTPLGKVQGALAVLDEQSRRRIVDGIAPRLVDAITAPPPKSAPGTPQAPDPSVPFKDAAFALLSHEPQIVNNDKTKAALSAALIQWVQTDFESRIDNTGQQFGVEQIMRFLGPPSARALPSIINETSTKVDRACSLVADIGDDDTKARAGQALVAIARRIDSTQWVDQQRALVNEANAKAKLTVTPAQVSEQLRIYQEQELEKIFTDMGRVGGRPVVSYCLGYAHDHAKSEKMRTDALLALENRIDRNSSADIGVLFEIVQDDANSDKVRGVALLRLGELPRDMLVTRLYTLFDKKWQVRLDAARLLLKSISLQDVPDFLQHLPQNDKAKMALTEVITYGALVSAMDSHGGPAPRDMLRSYFTSSSLGAKLTAVGSYYGAKKSLATPVQALEEDKSLVPRCDPADDCGWQCEIAKAPNSQERERKSIATVGEFVRWCIEPSLQGG
jgi:hypothetical protein